MLKNSGVIQSTKSDDRLDIIHLNVMLHMALDDYQTCTSKNNSRIRLIRSPVGDDSVRLDISRTISGITLQTTILMFRVIQLCYIINDLHVFLCIADGTR